MGAPRFARDATYVRRLRISRADDVERFCAFLHVVQVCVDAIDGAIVTASLPGAPSPMHERREIDGYVTTWNALNPRSKVELA
jgi:hypothetical protein